MMLEILRKVELLSQKNTFVRAGLLALSTLAIYKAGQAVGEFTYSVTY